MYLLVFLIPSRASGVHNINYSNGKNPDKKEKIFELKSNFAFDHIPTNNYQANSAYMQMSQMAHNLSISMQHEMGLARKNSSNPKTTRIYQTRKWKIFRFLILNRAGRIGWEHGKKVLDLTYNKATKQLYDRIVRSLENQNSDKATLFFAQLRY